MSKKPVYFNIGLFIAAGAIGYAVKEADRPGFVENESLRTPIAQSNKQVSVATRKDAEKRQVAPLYASIYQPVDTNPIKEQNWSGDAIFYAA